MTITVVPVQAIAEGRSRARHLGSSGADAEHSASFRLRNSASISSLRSWRS